MFAQKSASLIKFEESASRSASLIKFEEHTSESFSKIAYLKRLRLIGKNSIGINSIGKE